MYDDFNEKFAPLANDLLEKIPEYRGKYDHEMEYYGDLGWTFFGSILVKFTLVAFRAYKTDPQNLAAEDVVKRVFGFIEHYASSTDEDVLELIHTGFIEDLDMAAEDYDEFTAYLGPASREMLTQVEERFGRPTVRR